ncbi:MAG: PIN domain-containing protein [Nanoarchaeota archaeon]
MTKTIFFDTYAIIEVLKFNKNYQNYLDYEIVTTKLNLFELYYKLFREKGEIVAKTALQKYSNCILDFDNNVIEEAAKMRFMFKKQDMSMVDCIGYIKAKQLGIKFLTGDKQFEYLPDVEFVK